MLHRISRRLGLMATGPEIPALTRRIQELEHALRVSQEKNRHLADQLRAQRDKTRELYARTKEYAARLNARR
jgi:predicted  nucleic acid-binding Zn-ribbon protein